MKETVSQIHTTPRIREIPHVSAHAPQATSPDFYTEAVISTSAAVPYDEALNWYDFLARPRLPSPSLGALEQLREASTLVTGAGGSIGSALSMRLATLHPRRLTLLDASEQALHRLQSELAAVQTTTPPRIVLGNVANTAQLDEILEAHRPQLIFHAAAYKHVHLLEEHPLEALANNALATRNLIECATRAYVSRTVLLSTDKAVAPISILGASKRIAEHITLASSGVVLRLANVLGTEGSVSETFLRQIATGQPITITDPRAERYFLTREESVDLLLTSAVAAQPGSLLVPDIDRQQSIALLANFLISACQPQPNPSIVFTGLRPGDKLREALWESGEHPMPANDLGYLPIQPQPVNPVHLYQSLLRLDDTIRERDLSRAMEITLQLVPTYTPGLSMLALMQTTRGALAR